VRLRRSPEERRWFPLGWLSQLRYVDAGLWRDARFPTDWYAWVSWGDLKLVLGPGARIREGLQEKYEERKWRRW
jgi:hypothetical protein